MIDASKSYTTREGGAVRILCTDHEDPLYPVVASVVYKHTSFRQVFLYTAEGRYEFAEHGRHDLDLVLAPPAPTLKAEHVELSIAPSYGVVCALCGREGHASPACPWALTVVHGEAACG